jgi:alkylation response protein AidB-like acyl-CoA dehydrogenase
MTGTRTDELRSRIRRFVAENPPPDLRGADRQRRIAGQRSWAATMFDNGMAGPAWPKRYGGMALGFSEQVAYHDEFARLGVPPHPGNGPSIAGPTLIKFASDEQKDRYLRAMLRADEIWAQGFSEPGAGSDLQALRTTARRDGADYIVDGAKIWSTYADVAEMTFTLVRTGSGDSGADGISYLLIDLRSDGVTVRPLRDMSGESRFSQVFFDDVRVPMANRVGDENGGWALARTTLANERAARALSQASAYRRRMDALTRLLAANSALEARWARNKLAACEIRVRILMLNAHEAIAALDATGVPGASSSTTRLYHTLVEQEMYELAVDLLGPAGLVGSGEGAVQGGRWLKGFLHSRGATIGAGTAEIQRNTIAEQILGLPREVART